MKAMVCAVLVLGLLGQDEGQEDVYGWNGEPPDASAALGAVAGARARMEVEGDLDGAEEALEEVWLQATANEGFEGQEELLVQVALARAEVFRRRGQLELASRATRELLIRQDATHFRELRAKLTRANQALRVRALQAAKDARLVKLRQEILTTARGDDGSEDSLEAIVNEACDAEDWDVLRELGAPAQPYLMERILANLDGFPQRVQDDLLAILIGMNRAKAAELLLPHLDAGGYLWKRRIVRAMESNDVLGDDAWTRSSPSVCLEPGWLYVLETLLAAPDTALQSVSLVRTPFLHDALTAGLQGALVHGIEAYGRDFVNALVQVLDADGVVDSARPVYEAAARHPSVEVRRFAADKLRRFESSGVLLALADDPDPAIRASVVWSLGPHSGWFLRLDSGGGLGRDTRDWNPPLGEEERGILRRLCGDAEASVRTAAAEKLYGLTPPLADELYLGLTADPSARVRAIVARVVPLPPALRGEILARLSSDPDGDVLEAVQQQLLQLPLEDPGPFLPALRERMLSARYSLAGEFVVHKRLLQTAQGARALVGWALEASDGGLLDRLFDYANVTTNLLRVDDPTLARLFVRAQEFRQDNRVVHYRVLENAIEQSRPPRDGALLLVVADADVEPSTRLQAARLAAPGGGEALRRALGTLLSADAWLRHPPGERDLKDLEDTVAHLPADERNGFVLDAVRDAAIPDALAVAVAGAYQEAEPLGREVTLAVLARWFDPERLVWAVEKALGHLAALGDEADREVLKAAVRRPEYAPTAIQTMVALRDPVFLPTLGRCLEAEWITDEPWRKEVRYAAARGIASFLSDEAGELLLQGLSSPDLTLRGICRDGLDNIQATRERIRSWEGSRAGRPTEESALAELVGMLADGHPEVRAQAVRGIASFGRIEYLPTLIRLLEDPDDDVKRAAVQAIDTLNHLAAERRSGAASGD